MKLRVSKYNELHFDEVKKHVKVAGNLIKSPNANGRFLGLVKLGIGNRESEYSVYSDDEVIINNVRFCLAFAPDEYFDQFVEIN